MSDHSSYTIRYQTIFGFAIEEKKNIESSSVISCKSCTDSFYLALCTCTTCKYLHDYIYTHTHYEIADILKLREIYKEYRMSQPRFMSLLQHAHKEWIEQNQLLPRFFQLFNIMGTEPYLVFHLFVLGIAILQEKTKLDSIEQLIFETFAVNDELYASSIDTIFSGKDEQTQKYVAIMKYYIHKWDTTTKGYLTYDEFLQGMSHMNPVNKDFIFEPFHNYSVLYQNSLF